VRSPQVRTRSFPAQSPHLRRLALTTRASRSLARSPCSASPSMRFVFLDSRFRSTLPPHARSPSRSCASLRSRWSTHGRTSTSKIAPMLGAQKKEPASWAGSGPGKDCVPICPDPVPDSSPSGSSRPRGARTPAAARCPCRASRGPWCRTTARSPPSSGPGPRTSSRPC